MVKLMTRSVAPSGTPETRDTLSASFVLVIAFTFPLLSFAGLTAVIYIAQIDSRQNTGSDSIFFPGSIDKCSDSLGFIIVSANNTKLKFSGKIKRTKYYSICVRTNKIGHNSQSKSPNNHRNGVERRSEDQCCQG